ncbi:MAG: hypothetical protein DBP02_07820 [gamma proteobacterium symbiont of Ctena orbiculata]|nr:MAG: hypothetical protein DBP02_07820 [gamma proteobacterium symbiont of Ctena orbiculata]PUB88833.1 MAG: hypothetical protein DBP01_11315 [gamma proteobacterium symbiont of Ctena orbiculata]
MHTTLLEVREQVSGMDCLWIVVNHHQVGCLDMSACAHDSPHSGEAFFYMMYLIMRQVFINMNNSIGIETDHLLLPPCISVKFEISADDWEYNVGIPHHFVGLNPCLLDWIVG